MPEEKKQRRFRLIVGFTLIVLAFFTVLQSVSLRHEDKRQRDCVENYLTDTIDSLNERTTYTSEVADADRAQNEAFLKIAELSLRVKNPPPMEEQVAVVKAYRNKLRTYLALQTKAQKARVQNPYPTREEFRECSR